MAWLYLAFAGLCEIGWAVGLKYTEGFSRPLPTVLTIGAIDFATVVLAESSLSFLGLGIQAPAFTWGSMVATGRGYLASAWWVAFWPGLAILLTTLSLNILSSWWRTYSDPHQRWRLELAGKRKRK